MIIKKFEEQVVKFPQKTAVKAGDSSLTYIQLNRYSNRIAHTLIAGTHKQKENMENEHAVVSLLFEHGPHMIAGILGTLKAGCIYVPLDINYPAKRLLYMLEHSGSTVILTNRKNSPLAETIVRESKGLITILTIDTITDDVPGENIEREVQKEKPAYILYTSGSTGNIIGYRIDS